MLNPISPEFLQTLSAAIPGLLRDAEPRDLEEPRGRWVGQGRAVACPRTTAEVSAVVKACADARVGIVPLGGGTGLVGGQLSPDGPEPLILSLERMTALRGAYPSENVLVVEAGMILQNVQEEAEKLGRLFPLSLASEGSARIGGNLAANAGGVNVLRYGNTRDLVLGIEAVMPDGSIFNGLKRLRKDNTGYDLRHLLIGSEGTLGIITAVSLRLFPRPASRVSALVAVPSPDAALKLLALAEGRLSGMISAFELIHRAGYEFIEETMPQTTVPLSPLPEWSVLLDLGLPREIEAEEALAMLYAEADDAGLVTDGVIAANEAQRAALWKIRETIPQANRKIGAISSHDISLPLSEIAGFIPRATEALSKIGQFRINCFGHLGDGNLHFNVFPVPGKSRKDHEHQRDQIKACVHDIVDELGGSVSAEHGIGRLKVSDLEKYGDPAKLAAMRAIKVALDPLGIMNPGAVLQA
ncbi:FAD-binding oxidoreductase [Thioclava sp. FR2]|uniref:FAD-binding oxidoreductase n=1 Tax=Thioclava sp. FR2 TaxID=3445780 RepID=UPI003EB7C28F